MSESGASSIRAMLDSARCEPAADKKPHLPGFRVHSPTLGVVARLVEAEAQYSKALSSLASDLIQPIRAKVNPRHWNRIEGFAQQTRAIISPELYVRWLASVEGIISFHKRLRADLASLQVGCAQLLCGALLVRRTTHWASCF